MRRVELGPAVVEVDEDTVFLNHQSTWTASNLGGFLALLEQIRAEHGCVFAVSDVSAGLSISADARKRIAAWARDHTLDATVMVNASLAARAVVTLLMRGAQLISGKTSLVYFANTQEEARAIIDRERARLRK